MINNNHFAIVHSDDEKNILRHFEAPGESPEIIKSNAEETLNEFREKLRLDEVGFE